MQNTSLHSSAAGGLKFAITNCDMSAKKSILVIEDNHDMRVCLRQELEDQGYRVTSATNGQDALKLILSGYRPDSIVLDLQMPIMTGYQFLHEKELIHDLDKTPITLISGDIPDEAVEDYDFFSKPVNWGEFTDHLWHQFH